MVSSRRRRHWSSNRNVPEENCLVYPELFIVVPPLCNQYLDESGGEAENASLLEEFLQSSLSIPMAQQQHNRTIDHIDRIDHTHTSRFSSLTRPS